MFSQFCGTSLWFSGNAVITELAIDFYLPDTSIAHLTAAVQIGFIFGTLVFALLSLADRFSPSKVFVVSTMIAALFNLGLIWNGNSLATLLILRFLTGFFLAGIYPVGMKIAADYYRKGLGRSLGYLVGALVLGTALPHLLKGFLQNTPWQLVMVFTSLIAAMGGSVLMLLVPNGPYRKLGMRLKRTALFKIFENRNLNRAAIGYFAHMWELYAFWVLVPLVLNTYNTTFPDKFIPVNIGSFGIIAIGSISCILSGLIAEKIGAARVAKTALLLSGLCCLLSPFLFEVSSGWIVLLFLGLWGMFVIADSPLFSSLVANNATRENKGTAITIVTCLGFAVSILSIEGIYFLNTFFDIQYLLPLLAIGPVVGLIVLREKRT